MLALTVVLFIYLFLVVLEFESGPQYLLGRCYTT
jgi:hypothetical protein